ncbi:hypothetical protein Tco_1307210 [Tanacetum coccineum]
MRKKCSTLGFSLLKEFKLLFSRNYLIGTLKLSKSSNFLKARWRFFLALMERTSESWMFHDCPGFLKPLVLAVLSFVHKSFKSSASIWESDIQILSTNVFL